MRIGIFGGTFDPVHYGHLVLAEQCREQCRLDCVWFVPARVPPHKQGAEITAGKARVEMLQFAVAGCPEFEVKTLELEREGPSYTVDTLAELQREDASRELFLLMGADSLRDLPTWREPARILALATLVVVNRGGGPPPDLDALRGMRDAGSVPHVADAASIRSAASAPLIELVEIPGIDISATDLRRRVQEGRSLRFFTPRAVETYIHEHGLYR